METNYHIAYDKGWEDLKKKSPVDIANTMNVSYLSDKQQFIVPYLNENYIVNCNEQTIHNQADDTIPEIGTSILILHYITFFQTKAELVNQWVSLKEIPKGGILFYPAFHKHSILGLIKTFKHQPSFLLECAKKIGGQPASLGHVSVVFKMFPKIPICVILWRGDDEIEANATILFDPSIEHFLHIESIICAGNYLANHLIKLATPQSNSGSL